MLEEPPTEYFQAQDNIPPLDYISSQPKETFKETPTHPASLLLDEPIIDCFTNTSLTKEEILMDIFLYEQTHKVDYKEWQNILDMDSFKDSCDRYREYKKESQKACDFRDEVQSCNFCSTTRILQMAGVSSIYEKYNDAFALMNKVFLEFDKLYAQRSAEGKILPNQYIGTFRNENRYKVKNGKIVNREKYETGTGHFHVYGLNMFRNHHTPTQNIQKEEIHTHFTYPEHEL